jgi:hypothetical protein
VTDEDTWVRQSFDRTSGRARDFARGAGSKDPGHGAGAERGMWLDSTGNPMTDAAKITERFRRIDFGRMDIELTVNDPKAYTKPWTVTLHQVIKLDTDLLDFVCSENEKDSSHLSAK